VLVDGVVKTRTTEFAGVIINGFVPVHDPGAVTETVTDKYVVVLFRNTQ
jgi:hypothetical protein